MCHSRFRPSRRLGLLALLCSTWGFGWVAHRGRTDGGAEPVKSTNFKTVKIASLGTLSAPQEPNLCNHRHAYTVRVLILTSYSIWRDNISSCVPEAKKSSILWGILPAGASHSGIRAIPLHHQPTNQLHTLVFSMAEREKDASGLRLTEREERAKTGGCPRRRACWESFQWEAQRRGSAWSCGQMGAELSGALFSGQNKECLSTIYAAALMSTEWCAAIWQLMTRLIVLLCHEWKAD